jgi:hypothetical protein
MLGSPTAALIGWFWSRRRIRALQTDKGSETASNGCPLRMKGFTGMFSGIGFLVVRAVAERLPVKGDVLFAETIETRAHQRVQCAAGLRSTHGPRSRPAALPAMAQCCCASCFADARAYVRDMTDFAPFQRGPSGKLIAGN